MNGDEVITGGYATYARVKTLEARVADLDEQAIVDRARLLDIQSKLLELETALLNYFREGGDS